jgi:hypothetical protein
VAIEGRQRLMVVGAVAVVVVAGGVLAVVRLTGDEASDDATAAAYAPEIDPAEFTTDIDNPYMPLRPGTRWVYEGEGDDGESERIEVEVTDDTRQVMGVTVAVVHDTEFVEGEMVEDTYDWFAQDAEGNVWYFGEETAEYEDGEVVSTAGAWEAGVDGAQPGIVMRAAPRVGDTYRQEFYAGEAEDMGEVIELDRTVTVPFGSFDGVLVTRDWTPLEPDVEENKFYAPGVGMVAEETVEGGSSRAELVEMTERSGS